MTEHLLTEEKALQICAELWDWLAEDDGRYKTEWPGWEKYGECEASCPCCEYHKQNEGDFCGETCLMTIAWPDSCMSKESSLYTKWSRAEGGDHSPEVAKQIANKAREALENLKRR